MRRGSAWVRGEEPGLADKAGKRLREEAARARVQIGATGPLLVDQEAARRELTEEERARRGSRPNSRRWRALNKLDGQIDALRQRQADAAARLTAAEELLKRAPEDDAATLAAWLEAGEKGERPAATVYERERDRDAARLLVAALERKVDAALERRLRHLERHRTKMLRDAREDVDAARDRLLELVAQLREARGELLAARDVLLWIAHYPDLPEAFGFPTALALGLRAPVERNLQTSSRVEFGGAVAALEADADALADRYGEETQRRLGTAPPRTPTREAMWTDDPDYQALAKQERQRATGRNRVPRPEQARSRAPRTMNVDKTRGGGGLFSSLAGDPARSRRIPPREEDKGEKTCRKCGEVKPCSDFRRNARTKDGLSSWCGECHNAANRRYRRDAKVAALLAEAAEYERKADEGGLMGASARSTAAAVRREAERLADA